MTADPPVNNMAVTSMLVKRPNVMYTKCVAFPYRARTASRNVYGMVRSESTMARICCTHMSVRGSPLEFDRNGRKEQDLYGSTSGIPERSRNT